MQTHFLFDVLEGYKPFEQMVQESQKSGAGEEQGRTRKDSWKNGRRVGMAEREVAERRQLPGRQNR